MIRYEAGTMFHSKVHLYFDVVRLDFRPLQKFVQGLPVYYQQAFARNPQLTVVIRDPHYFYQYIYSKKNLNNDVCMFRVGVLPIPSASRDVS